MQWSELTTAEHALVEAVIAGKEYDAGKRKDAAPNAPVRAEVLRALILERVVKNGAAMKVARPEGVQLAHVTVSGDLDMDFIQLNFPLVFVACNFQKPLQLRYANLAGLFLGGSTLQGGLRADGCAVTGNLNLSQVKADDAVWLLGAKIGGQLDCNGANFSHKNNYALVLDGAEIAGHVFFRDSFKAEGTVSLLGAHIGGQLDCRSATFLNEEGCALLLERINVASHVFLSEGFKAHGAVILLGAKVGGQVNCRAAMFSNPKGFALVMDGAKITGHVFLNYGFKAHGEVSLLGARAGGHLDCIGAIFTNRGRHALTLQGLECSEFWFYPHSCRGLVSLLGARAKILVCEEKPPPECVFRLDGFAYDDVFIQDAPDDSPAGVMQAWLKRSKSFSPQPWERLEHVLRRTGRERDADKVGMEKQRVQRRYRWRIVAQEKKSPLRKMRLSWWALWRNSWSWVSGAFTGYGYRPGRLLVALAGFYIALFLPLWGILATYVGEGDMLFIGQGISTAFSPAVYALDALLPIVNLYHLELWQPAERAVWIVELSSLASILGWLLLTLALTLLPTILQRRR